MPGTAKRYDAVIVGGSFAGISAGLQLARARRSILVIDSGRRRNRFASHAHGFFGQDGREPEAILAEARTQLLAYPTVVWREATATGAQPEDDGFAVNDSAGERHRTRRILLATGVEDELPALPGLKERWGKSVLHCPYCHGYELGGGRLGVLASGAHSPQKAALVADWGEVTLFLNGEPEPDAEALTLLARRGVAIERVPLAGIEGEGEAMSGVRLADGRLVPLKALFATGRVCPAGSLAAELGCELEEMPFGVIVRADEWKRTSVPGVFVAGDVAVARHSIASAVADGATAAVGLHQSLL